VESVASVDKPKDAEAAPVSAAPSTTQPSAAPKPQ
jgi:hypothetical protein